MLDFKKTSTILMLLSTGLSFAGATNPILAKFNTQQWEFGGRALYFQPNVNSDDAVHISAGGSDPAAIIKNPQWGFGFMLEGAYNINSTNNINLNWYHLTSNINFNINESRTINLPSQFSTSIIDTQEEKFSAARFDDTKYNITPKWDMVNLEFGKNLNFSQYNAMRLHGGLEFTHLSSHNSLAIIGALTSQNHIDHPFNNSMINNNAYSGFGPRLGIDMHAISEQNFELYAKGAIAFLVGPNKYNTTTNDNILSMTTTINNSITSIVPAIDGKLGINYVYKLSQGKLMIDCGWMWINYFNAMMRQDDSNPTIKNIAYDFGLNGLYWGLKWLGG